MKPDRMTWRRALFALVLAGTLVAALLPSAVAPDLGDGDKVNHVAAFVTLSLLAAWAWPAPRLWLIAAAMSAFGAAIEGLQALPVIARDAEWADWIADTGAAALTLLLVAALRRLMRSAPD